MTDMSQPNQAQGMSKAARKRANKKKRALAAEAVAAAAPIPAKKPDAAAPTLTAMITLREGAHEYRLNSGAFPGLFIPSASWRMSGTSIAVVRGDAHPGFITLQVGNVQRVYGAGESRPLVLMQPGPWTARDGGAMVLRATVESTDEGKPMSARLSIRSSINFSNNPPPF